MNSILRHRKLVRLFLIGLALAGVLVLNIVLLRSEDSSLSWLLIIAFPALALLNEFLPEIVSYISKRFGPSEYTQFIDKCVSEYQDFIRDYFVADISLDDDRPKDVTLFNTLENLALSLDDANVFGSTMTANRRRRPISILLFLIKNTDKLEIEDHENLLPYIKLVYKDLTDTGKREFICSYEQLVLHDKHFINPNQYFAAIDDDLFEASRLRFFDRFMKDDYINEIAEMLNLKDAQIRSFKESVKTVAESDEFNLKYLRDFVQKRENYRKLFIVTADKRFSKRVQAWIRQQPHFILNYASITNLPRIGISGRFDIFFFSPNTLIPSASALFDQFRLIDANVDNHPVRIFEIDPSEGFRASLSKSSEFAQAISYFEAGTFDPTALEELSYHQLISILEERKVSLQTIIGDLPPSEFSTVILPVEKDLFNQLLSEFTVDEPYSVFALTKMRLTDVRKAFEGAEETYVAYSDIQAIELFSGKVTEAKKRNRILDLFREVKNNLVLIDDFIQ